MFLKQCIVCGKEFKTTDKRIKICSDECKKERRNQQARDRLTPGIEEKQTERECLHCGKTFIPETRYNLDRMKFCSAKCRQNFKNKERWAALAPPDPEPRICIICGNEFSPPRKSPNAQTCSKECNVKNQQNKGKDARREIREEVLSEKRLCKNCGNEFLANAQGQIHCSEECRLESRNTSRRENMREIPLSVKSKWEKAKRCRGNWAKALERDEHKCQVCGATEGIVVHHLDCRGDRRKNGKRISNRNDSLDNLITLCPQCHRDIHGVFLVLKDGEWVVYSPLFSHLDIDDSIRICKEIDN